MRFRSSIIALTAVILSTFLLSTHTFAESSYTKAQVSTHNTTSSCWVSFESSVYDITSYLRQHDRYMNIRSWCGTDMTVAFKTKDGQGQNHKSSSYSLLSAYRIGILSASVVTPATTTTSVASTSPVIANDDESDDDSSAITSSTSTVVEQPSTTTVITSSSSTSGNKITSNTNPYDFFTPFLATLVLYLASYIAMTSEWGKTHFSRKRFNSIWNTVLVLSLIPSALFGIYLIFRYSIPALAQIDFDFMYWHVEGSIVFATLAFAHLLLRFKIFTAQLKK